MRVAFFGLPLAALLLRADGHEIVYAGVCRKGAIGTRRLMRQLGERVAVVPKLGDARVQQRVRASRPDLVVSWFWTKKIPPEILTLAPLGTVGVHPSLLPRHRGPDPFFWTLFAGDREAGVTAHRLEREYDTGALLGQKRIPVDPSWNAWSLAKALDRPSLALLREVVSAFARGEPPPEVAQDESRATGAPAPSEDALELRPRTETAAALERLVRAAGPFPGAWLALGADESDESEMVVVTRAAVTYEVPRALAPGEAFVREGCAIVCAKEGALALKAGRLVGDDAETELDQVRLAELVARLSGAPALA